MSDASAIDELPGELMMWVLIVSELLVFGGGLLAFMAVRVAITVCATSGSVSSVQSAAAAAAKAGTPGVTS